MEAPSLPLPCQACELYPYLCHDNGPCRSSLRYPKQDANVRGNIGLATLGA